MLSQCGMKEDAAKIAVREVERFLSPASTSALCATVDKEEMEVIFCCFSERDVAVYQAII